MKISSKQASIIVESLRDVIEYNINFINTDSIIIASTDRNRIGDFHEGSKKVFETKKSLIIYDDDRYLGAKAGINHPVTFNDEIVAIIGITGKFEDVKKFSSVIVKMTEILVKEIYFRDQRELRLENERYLIDLLVNDLENTNAILKKAEALHIDLEDTKRIVIIKLEEKKYKYQNMRKLIFDSIKRRLKSNELIVNYHGDFILLLNESKFDDLKMIKQYITKKYGVDLIVGYGENFSSLADFSINYQKVLRIVTLSFKLNNFEIVTLNDFDLELILLNLDESIKTTYLGKVFGKVDENTLEQWSKMLLVFAKNNGSINLTSDELFIHKNTLQYRLKKVKEITGYDPRKLRDFTILYLATLLLNQSNNQQN